MPLSLNLLVANGSAVVVCSSEPLTIHSGLLGGLNLCRPTTTRHSGCEFMIAVAGSCYEDGFSQPFSLSSGSHILSAPYSSLSLSLKEVEQMSYLGLRLQLSIILSIL